MADYLRSLEAAPKPPYDLQADPQDAVRLCGSVEEWMAVMVMRITYNGLAGPVSAAELGRRPATDGAVLRA